MRWWPRDFSRFSSGIQFKQESRGSLLLAFGMGAVAALLAGACVAPVVVQVVLFASNLYATGTHIASNCASMRPMQPRSRCTGAGASAWKGESRMRFG